MIRDLSLTRRMRPAAAFLWLAVLLLPACAKIAPPSGGPPDLEPPRVAETEPDSGASGVPLDFRPSITFTEAMEPRSTMDAVEIAPAVLIKQRKWSGRTLTLVPDQPLDSAQTYTLYVSSTARDRHGNEYGGGATVVFSTASTFPPGSIAGELTGKGFSEEGCYLWCYVEGRSPDTTARDFDALGIVDEDSRFKIVGLAVPGTYRLWAFADLNGNRSFEERSDVLTPIDTTFVLTPEAMHADSIELIVVNPRAPGDVTGMVIDSLGDSTGVLRVVARQESDTTRTLMVDAAEDGEFEMRLDPGAWLLTAVRDLNANGLFDRGREPISDRIRIVVEPAGRSDDHELILRPRGAGP